jgi:hypothetical protein
VFVFPPHLAMDHQRMEQFFLMVGLSRGVQIAWLWPGDACSVLS